MKAKLTLAITSILAAVAGWATDFVWTGNSTAVDKTWADAVNWSPEGIPGVDDTATFDTAATPVRNEEASVGKLILNADVTLRFDKWLNVGAIEGDGKIILMNRGRLRNITGTAVVCTNDIEIVTPDGTDWDHHSAMPWIQGNGANFDIKGKLLGDGHVFFTMSGMNGVRLYGDNSGFSGSIHVDSNNDNRMKFGEAQSGSDNMTLNIYGSVTDNGSMLFSNGTIHFGSIYTHSYAAGAYFRSIDKHNALVIGNLNKDDRLSVGMGDDANAYAKIVKVGTGTLELGPTRHREGTIISNGVVKVTHPDGVCHKDSDLVFAGGKLEYGSHDGVAVTKDISTFVQNSTEYISVKTTGTDISWGTENLRTQNPNAKGIVKDGEGTLAFPQSFRDNFRGFFNSESCTNTINGGTLAVVNCKKNTSNDWKASLLGTGTLKLYTFEEAGSYRLRGNGSLTDFKGTIEWANTHDQSSAANGFMPKDQGNVVMADARFRITGNPESALMVMQGEVGNGKNTVTVGAFDHLYPNAQLAMKGAWILNITGNAGDSYLNGTFVSNTATINKTGANSSLKIGPDFALVAGSNLSIQEGTLELADRVNVSGDLNYTLTIASGVTLTGEGVFGAVDLSVNGVVAPELTADTPKDKEFTLLTATSITGTSTTMTSFLETVNASVRGGKWKLRKVANGDGTVTLKCVFAKTAFAIIVR